jgi:hypothetical protein
MLLLRAIPFDVCVQKTEYVSVARSSSFRRIRIAVKTAAPGP